MFASSTTTKDETLDASYLAAVNFCNFILENNPYHEKMELFGRFTATGNNKALTHAIAILAKKWNEEKAALDNLEETTGCCVKFWTTKVVSVRYDVDAIRDWHNRLSRANTANGVIEMTSLSK